MMRQFKGGGWEINIKSTLGGERIIAARKDALVFFKSLIVIYASDLGWSRDWGLQALGSIGGKTLRLTQVFCK